MKNAPDPFFDFFLMKNAPDPFFDTLLHLHLLFVYVVYIGIMVSDPTFFKTRDHYLTASTFRLSRGIP